MNETRQFPQSPDAERALLGGLLLDHNQVPEIAELLGPDDFYSAANGKIFGVMVARSAASEPLDVLGLADHVMGSGSPDEYGGLAYITQLPEQVPSTQNLGYYAKLVKEKSTRRELIRVAADINTKAMEGDEELEQVLDDAERLVFEVAQKRARKDWTPLGTAIESEWVKLEQRSQHSGDVTGVPTGFTDLDRMLAGLQPTDLIVLAARPAMGKTAFALNIAQRAALQGVGCGIFSLEMSAGQLAMRMLGGQAKVDAGKLRTGHLSQHEDWPKLEDAHQQLFHAPVWIDDSPGLSITQLRSKARRLASQNKDKLGLLVIDYIQLMTGAAGPRESREQQIASISRGLKSLAKELDLPIIALSQLNRGVESRTDKRPMISDLRESGAIEQDADIIMFIYRDEYYNENTTEPGVAEIIIAKQRNGPTGVVKLAFVGKWTRFENLSMQQGYA
jgi:replicative DNA helicase